MPDKSSDNKRLARNTLYLYMRTLIVMGVTIFTSRIILDVLGVEDYGIYNVVGGFVSMFAVLSGTLTASSQRFIAFELGKKDSNVKQIFSTTVSIHAILAIGLFALLECFGLWFLNHKMNIVSERMMAANWVFHCSVITFCVNLFSIPYNAAIVAYERMSAFAYISIFEVLCKLGAVYALYVIAYDSLIVYAVFMLVVAIFLRCLYGIYCNRHFAECHYEFTLDRKVFREMMGFSGWNFIGSSASILNNQGINILTNLYFGVVYNAARGIAMQVDSAINTFVQNFMMALNPQITKNYAAGKYGQVNTMIYMGTKYAFFLFWIICLPIYLNTDFLLSIWLKEVPLYASVFIRLGIIYNLCQNLSQCLYIAMLATGKIKKYQIIVGGLSILAFPASWLFFEFGLPSEWGYWAMIIFSIICLMARLVILQDMIPCFSASLYMKEVLLPIFFTVLPTSIVLYYTHKMILEITFFKFLIETVCCLMICGGFIYYVGLKKAERRYLLKTVQNRIHK